MKITKKSFLYIISIIKWLMTVLFLFTGILLWACCTVVGVYVFPVFMLDEHIRLLCGIAFILDWLCWLGSLIFSLLGLRWSWARSTSVWTLTAAYVLEVIASCMMEDLFLRISCTIVSVAVLCLCVLCVRDVWKQRKHVKHDEGQVINE